MQNCIFCNIIAGSLPSTKIYENKHLIVIKDLHPQAPIHYLIIPKKHIINIKDTVASDIALLGELLYAAKHLACQLDQPQDFTIKINNGKTAGQCVFHMHVHFLAPNSFSR